METTSDTEVLTALQPFETLYIGYFFIAFLLGFSFSITISIVRGLIQKASYF